MGALADCHLKEIEERLGDWRWRLGNLYWITDKEGNRVLFEMNWAQEALFAEMHFLNIILKARQLGFSTFVQVFMLDACLFNPNMHAGTVAHTLDAAEEIFQNKIRFPYDNLDPQIKAMIGGATQDSAKTLRFGNNSSISVGTSYRSGTLNYLHISEHGKICAKYPEKAKEIRTGALNTVQAGQLIFIESTAEGQAGDFYDYCQEAQTKQRQGERLTELDFKFFFFPWWKEPGYRLDPTGVTIPAPMQKYFGELAKRGITLTDAQKAWYVKKAETQRKDMKREYPSTPEEAFEAAIEGAYYGEPMAQADADGRVTIVPHDPALGVETWWDLGVQNPQGGADTMAIWFVQRAGKALHVIDYYGNSGEGLAHYAGVLKERQKDRGYLYNRHIWPHDGKHFDMGAGKKRNEVMADHGFVVDVQLRQDVADGIEATRNMLARCWFDKEKCAEGLKALRSYRKEWDEARATWKDKPYGDWASHPADAFRTGAMAEIPGKVDVKGAKEAYDAAYPKRAFA